MVLCACSWYGVLLSKDFCPACNANHNGRVSKEHVAVLVDCETGSRPQNPHAVHTRWHPAVRNWLRSRGLIVRVGGPTPPAPGGIRLAKSPRPPYVLTELGAKVLAASRAMSEAPPLAVAEPEPAHDVVQPTTEHRKREYIPKSVDMTGMRFDHLLVVRQAGCNRDGVALWECACNCGGSCVVPRSKLLHKQHPTRSCGCLGRRRTVTDNSQRRAA
jgi:hypothetical protein